MSDTRSRSGILVGLAAAVGAFGAAAMMSAAIAPTAHADDFTDVINAVDHVYSSGQIEFGIADTDFGGSNINDGLAAFFSAVDDDFVGGPDTLYVGSLDLLANDPVALPVEVVLPPETSFASALTEAETAITDSQDYFSLAATDLSSGDYAGAAYLDSFASLYDVISLQLLLEGAVASF